MNGRTPAVFCLVLALSALAANTAAAAEPDWYFQHPDSFPRLPTNKLFYLEQKHGLCPSQRQRDLPESLNVRMVSKWGGGPSWAVTGRDTLVYLSRGSEVVVLSFADTANPRILNHIQAKRLAGRPVLSGSLLYLVTSGYIEVFDVADPTNAPRVGRLSVPVADIDVQDSLVYLIGADSFMVYNFTDPANPVRLGVCRDSGYALDVDRGYAYLRDRWGMYILDARDPASPRRVASWGTDIAGVKVRGNYCYVAQGQMGSGSLHVLNVSNPAAPWEEGRLSGLTGEDIYLVDTLLFLPGFDVVNVADSSRPRLVANEPSGGGSVWVHDSLRYGVTAGWTGGLRVLNLVDITGPVLDTTMLGGDEAHSIAVAGNIACVSAYSLGMLLFDVTDPAAIREVGRYDTTGVALSPGLAVTESLAYVSAFGTSPREVLHAVDITDPARPQKVGAGVGFNPVSAIVLRDSFLYCAEDYKFEVFSVADPRQPVWRGSCNLSTSTSGISVRDSFAYLAPNIYTINIARPSQPVLVGSTTLNCNDVAVSDTFCYVAHARESLMVYSVAQPSTPHRLTSTWVSGQAYNVTLSDTYAYLGCSDFRVFNISEPATPALVGQYATPYRTFSIDSGNGYLFAACYLAGVCILEQLATGVAEAEPGAASRGPMRLVPNLVRRGSLLELPGAGAVTGIRILDPTGRVAASGRSSRATNNGVWLDLSHLKPGVYFLQCRCGRQSEVVRFTKL